MAYYGGYYPYAPDLHSTVHLGETFPEHHHLFEHARHKISGIVAPEHDYEMKKPRVDVRETSTSYYIDVELPGLGPGADLKMHWTSGRTLLVDAHIKRPLIEGTTEHIPGPAEASAVPADTESTGEKKANGNIVAPKNPVHLTLRERRVGEVSRAFNFAVDVDKENVKANLKFGLLTLIIPKSQHDPVEKKEIEITHG